MNKYAKFIKEKLTQQELLEQLAEECCELGKAALKVIRAAGMSSNVTPVTYEDAMKNFTEELLDVISVAYLISDDSILFFISEYWKYERWAKRLGYEDNL